MTLDGRPTATPVHGRSPETVDQVKTTLNIDDPPTHRIPVAEAGFGVCDGVRRDQSAIGHIAVAPATDEHE